MNFFKNKTRDSIRVYLVVILFIGAVLRFMHINQPLIDAFFWREASTAMMADNFYNRSWNIFYPEVSWGGPGPNYQGREFQAVSYAAALLYTVLGQHDWIGRSIAAIFGVWGIYALYKLVSRVWDKKRALASAAVMAVLPGSIFIDRSFLPDPVMVALVTTSLWMLIVYLQTERLVYLLLAGATGVFGFLTKIPGLIIGLPMAYAILAVDGKNILQPKRLALFGSFAILTLIPVVSYYLWARHLSLTYPPFHFAGAGNWIWDEGLQKWWGQNYFISRLAARFTTWIWTAPVLLLVLTGFILRPPGIKDLKTKKDEPSTGSPVKPIRIFQWWIVAGVIYYFIGAKELIDNPWNFHIINPAAAALAGHAIISIGSLKKITWPPARSAVTLALLLIVFGYGQSGLRWMYYPYAKESYKLGLALQKKAQPGDLIFTVSSAFADPAALYYSKRRGWVFPLPHAWDRGSPEKDKDTIRIFEELRTDGAKWLGIVNERLDDLRKNHTFFMEHITTTCILDESNKDWVIYRIPPRNGFTDPYKSRKNH